MKCEKTHDLNRSMLYFVFDQSTLTSWSNTLYRTTSQFAAIKFPNYSSQKNCLTVTDLIRKHCQMKTIFQSRKINSFLSFCISNTSPVSAIQLILKLNSAWDKYLCFSLNIFKATSLKWWLNVICDQMARPSWSAPKMLGQNVSIKYLLCAEN